MKQELAKPFQLVYALALGRSICLCLEGKQLFLLFMQKTLMDSQDYAAGVAAPSKS